MAEPLACPRCGAMSADDAGELCIGEDCPVQASEDFDEALRLYHAPAGVGVPDRLQHGRVLLESDAFCPSCGHNRDTSSVSSVDLGNGRKGCQFCAQEWDELPASGVVVDRHQTFSPADADGAADAD